MQDHEGGVLNPEANLGSHLPRFLLSVETLNSKKHRLYADSWVVVTSGPAQCVRVGEPRAGTGPRLLNPSLCHPQPRASLASGSHALALPGATGTADRTTRCFQECGGKR